MEAEKNDDANRTAQYKLIKRAIYRKTTKTCEIELM